MKVAMVSEHASPLAALGGEDAGGQNVHVQALAENLARRGIEVVVHTRRDDANLPERVPMGRGVTVHHVDAGPPDALPKDDLLVHMPEFGRRLREAWADDLPDVVHTHFWMSALAALEPAQELGVPLVHTFHALGVVKRRYQGEKDTSPEGRLDIERDIVHRADRIVATCTDEVFELVRQDADSERLAVVPCGVDLARFTPRGPRQPRRRGLQRIVSVSRLVERKGVGNVVSALHRLPGVELVVAGGPERAALDDDPEARRLRAIAREAGVEDRLDLRGRVSREELPLLLRSADAVVCAPWYEPFGMVALEAMACSVPVVASAVGGMIDTVVDGVTGVHIPPRDPDRLADALHRLLACPDRRRRYGAAGAERAQRLYDWERVAGATLDVYRRLIDERAGVAGARARAGRAARRFTRRPGAQHLDALRSALHLLDAEADRLEAWGRRLAGVLTGGGRLLTAGNGGSAAEAQHLTAELVGRFEDERRPLSAVCLHADTSSLTAIANDYGLEEAFARQVRAHGRSGDVLLCLSTSGSSANVVAAARAARQLGVEAWALTGPAPNPLAACCDDAICLAAASSATVQELHLVAVHLLCGVVDRAVARGARDGRVRSRARVEVGA